MRNITAPWNGRGIAHYQKATKRGLRIRSRIIVHACPFTTVCTDETKTITRARTASSKQKTQIEEADEEESSAAPVDDEHTLET